MTDPDLSLLTVRQVYSHLQIRGRCDLFATLTSLFDRADSCQLLHMETAATAVEGSRSMPLKASLRPDCSDCVKQKRDCIIAAPGARKRRLQDDLAAAKRACAVLEQRLAEL